MERHTHQWTISLPPVLSKQALKAAQEESRTKSELVREALRQYMARRERFQRIRLDLAHNLKRKGVHKLADIERMIDSGRA